jgi:L-aspartate oxidase
LSIQRPLGVDRCLLGVDPLLVPAYRFDVLVVGSGVAGASAALAAAEQGADVALLAKGELAETNTFHAQGGLATVLGPADSFAAHERDTLAVGCGLCDEVVVAEVVRGGPAAVDRLVGWGASFDSDSGGRPDLSREGGHTHPRVLHTGGDATGREIQRTLLAAVDGSRRLRAFTHTFAVDLQVAEDGSACGLLALDARGDPVGFSARQVVLAAGGAGQIYRETTNPELATGDGVALGFRAGAVARDLEFYQFHPTCLYIAGAARVLISEVVRGAGGVLRDRHGQRFMPEAHPDAELAPRDVVSRAVFERMVATADTNVYLDLSAIRGDPHKLFPGISRICRFFGIDIARDPVPVRPGAHYMIGGLRVDRAGRTSVPGLWAAGECASSGLHGANRLGSNSLLEGLVLGTAAGEGAARAASGAGPPARPRPFACRRHGDSAGLSVNLEDVTYSLKSLMWRQMGIRRNGEALDDALAKIALWTRAVRELAPPTHKAVELQNMLLVARLATEGARAREESRGVHWRSDFPETRETWRAHTDLAALASGDELCALEFRRAPAGGAPAAPAAATRTERPSSTVPRPPPQRAAPAP